MRPDAGWVLTLWVLSCKLVAMLYMCVRMWPLLELPFCTWAVYVACQNMCKAACLASENARHCGESWGKPTSA